jgi:hypothetical protein
MHTIRLQYSLASVAHSTVELLELHTLLLAFVYRSIPLHVKHACVQHTGVQGPQSLVMRIVETCCRWLVADQYQYHLIYLSHCLFTRDSTFKYSNCVSGSKVAAVRLWCGRAGAEWLSLRVERIISERDPLLKASSKHSYATPRLGVGILIILSCKTGHAADLKHHSRSSLVRCDLLKKLHTSITIW